MDTSLNIIVVEDHDELREATVAALRKQGHVARGVDCAEALDDELAAFHADVLILDLNLPGEDGISLARRMRAAEPDVGIIMVTARDEVRDVEKGYGNGADIYMTKPVSAGELNAAITALSRRLHRHQTTDEQLILHINKLQLQGPQDTVNLSNLESSLLAALAKAGSHRLEAWQLLQMSGKEPEEQEKRALTVQMVRLRKKLIEAGAAEPTIKAIRGTGYQLCTPLVIQN